MENKTDLTQFKRIDLVDFAKSHGFERIRKASEKYVYMQRDAVKIAITRKGYDYVYTEVVLGVGGSVIDFCMQYVNGCTSIGLAIDYLKKYTGTAIAHEHTSIPVNSPDVKQDNTQLVQYLEKHCNYLKQFNTYLRTRGLFAFDISRHNVYSVKTWSGNAVFPMFLFDELCGILERNVKFSYIHKNCTSGLWHSKKGFDYSQILITESPIDNFSYQRLNPGEYFHVATCGSTNEAKIQYFVSLCKELNLPVIVGFDKDIAGKKMTANLCKVLSQNNIPYTVEVPFYKDFNEDLTLQK